MEDVENADAISSHRRTLTLCPPGHPDRSGFLNSLAVALCIRFERLGRMEDLEDAISSHHEALALRQLGHPLRSTSLSNLGNALDARFEQLGTMDDLEDAISFHREAVALCPPGYPDCSGFLSNLAIALHSRFEQLGMIEDLEDAILSHRQALTLRPPGHPDHAATLNNLANALHTRFEILGGMEDLEDAISSHHKALALRPHGHPLRSNSLNNLGTALYTRFEQLGRIEDLEAIISSHREALTLRPPGHPDYFTSLNNLGNALDARFRQFGRIEDLEDAISSHRKALALCPPGHPAHSGVLNNLAIGLHTRSFLLNMTEDLDEAIAAHLQVLTLRPPGHPDRSSSLNNLGNALDARFEQSGRMEDLEGTISSHREAIALCPSGHPLRPTFLNNFGAALYTRFQQLGKMEDLEEAILSHREALALCPLGHPGYSVSLVHLANALNIRCIELGGMDDLDESFTLYEQAANELSSRLQPRLAAAVRWAATARHHPYRPTTIIRAYSTSLHLLRRCLILNPDVNSQQQFLAAAHVPKSLASDAAAAAIDAGELEKAVEFLEEGRAMLWSRMEGYRHPLDQLRQADRQLADQLETFSIELALSFRPGALSRDMPTAPAALEAQMQRHRILSEEWEEVVGRVRKIDGFANFLQAIPYQTLRMAAAEGPVVLINISKYRSDAIILHADNPRPILVPLPDAYPQDLILLAKQLVLARDSGSDNPSKLFLPILRDLWDNVISPVHERLNELGVPEKSRVWWCPTSKLCALPLHAAGPYLPKQKNLPDIYISSYIPTISSLIRARSNVLGHAVAPKSLVIGQTETLPQVQAEIDHLRQLGDFADVMVGEEANRDSILRGLQQNSWAHFACHGHLGDNHQPFHASFELHGGSRLTLLDLIQARLPNAELAFLSACHSAAGDLITPDETIHLAAAMQFCGFRSVVGTLWAMADEDGPTISKEFYKHMLRKPGNQVDFRDSAEALSLAIREMRKHRLPLHRWIMFIHIGA